ncbi:MAG: hypothetical protein ACI9K5_000726, partial [Gammaproteobacteria bacterium]
MKAYGYKKLGPGDDDDGGLLELREVSFNARTSEDLRVV